MLQIFSALRDLPWHELMEIYHETNQKRGAEIVPDESMERQRILAEQDLEQYLRTSFFTHKKAFYAVWIEKGQGMSALRLEPFQDGLLLEALETRPDVRGIGYASKLVSEVLAECTVRHWLPIYSHVSKRNRASLAVHRKCGFRIDSDYAALIDGTVSGLSYTLIYTENSSEKCEKRD